MAAVRKLGIWGALLFSSLPAFGQGQQHAAWSLTAETASVPPGATARIKAAVHIDPGWHLYSASSPGAMPASFQVSPERLTRVLQLKPHRAFDSNLNAETETFDGDTTFLLDVKVRPDVPAGTEDLAVSLRWQTCNDTACVPGKQTVTVPLTIDASATAPALAIPAGFSEAKPPAAGTPTGDAPADSRGWAAFLLVAFGAGLACIFTPCVFPMIPITMSYFLNQPSGEKKNGLAQAIVFCLGIIVLFSGLGLIVTAALGAGGVKQLGANPWVNGFIAVLFIAFGFSLLGAFEITIPSSVLTKLNASSGGGGFAGTLLMGLTFALSSFACVGPFVGTLLAASVSAGWMRPAVGMVVFATGLALPFFLLALFPSYLKKLPRSGGWMSRVKVVMGFVILAASLKYLSSVDQVLGWGLLTRERFLAAWIVLFGMAGLYLLGFVRIEGVKADENMGLGRLLTGMLFVIFAISLWPGMTGGNLGLFDAYVPMAENSTASSASSGGDLVWMRDRYQTALDQARAQHKLVLIDFTGYTCANCHWMRANILSRPEVEGQLRNFVLLELYTDGPTGDANSKFQLDKFHTVELPFYAVVDPDGNVVDTFHGRTTQPATYVSFLQKAQSTPTVTPAVAETAAPVAAAPATATAKPIALPDVKQLNGAPLDIAALNGKVVVVNFWATYCVPCIGELPTFNKISKEMAPKGVAIIGISMDDEGAPKVEPFLKKHPIEYTVGLGGDPVAQQYHLDAYPVTVVFDRSGKQIQRFDGSLPEADLMAAIKKAL